MKMYKINSLTTILFIFLISSLVLILPMVLIETLWNSTIAKSFNIAIDLWQALILWLMVLVTLNIFGLFKFEFAVETVDEDSLKHKIEKLKTKVEELKDTDPSDKETKI